MLRIGRYLKSTYQPEQRHLLPQPRQAQPKQASRPTTGQFSYSTWYKTAWQRLSQRCRSWRRSPPWSCPTGLLRLHCSLPLCIRSEYNSRHGNHVGTSRAIGLGYISHKLTGRSLLPTGPLLEHYHILTALVLDLDLFGCRPCTGVETSCMWWLNPRLVAEGKFLEACLYLANRECYVALEVC